MPDLLLNVPHRRQTQQADCLAACAAMILDYLNRPIPYGRLLRLFGIQSFGAPASRILRLSDMELSVTYQEGSVAGLEYHLQQGHPCIAFVYTGELPYWSEATNHAVVVVGLDDEFVYLNDPFFASAPQRVPLGDFILAWLARDYMYAVITGGIQPQ